MVAVVLLLLTAAGMTGSVGNHIPVGTLPEGAGVPGGRVVPCNLGAVYHNLANILQKLFFVLIVV